MKKTSLVLYSMLTGILIGTSTIPFPPWALFFSLSPILYFWTFENTKRAVAFTFLSLGFASMIGFFWIAHVLYKFAYIPLPLSVLICLVVTLLYHFHMSLAALVFTKWIRPHLKFPLLGAAAFFALIWYLVPTLFPWNFSLGWLYGKLPGYHFMDVAGADFLSALTVLINAAFLFSILNFKKNKSYLAYTLSFLFVFNLLGWLYGKSIPAPDQKISAVIGQGNIGSLEKRFQMSRYTYKQDTVDIYMKASEEGFAKAQGPVDYLIWPETALPEFYSPHFFQTYIGSQIARYVSEKKVALISGAYSETTLDNIANSMIFIDKNSKPIDPPVYKKILLAFGEYLPGEAYFPILRKWLPMAGDFERGPGPQVRVLPPHKVGIQICYEGVFAGFSRKLAEQEADFIVNATNDSWYGPFYESLQHLYLTALRAVETRTPIIRSTNTGISTVIRHDGSLMEKSPLYKVWGGHYEVPIYKQRKKTIYVRWGYRLTLPFLLIVLMISGLYGKFRT